MKRQFFGLVAAFGAVLAAEAAINVIPMPRTVVEKKGAFVLGGTNLISRIPVTVAKDAAIPSEGYRLTVDAKGAHITSSDAAGEFYARETLRQLPARNLVTCNYDVPFVEIEDSPLYRWRGIHWDDGRHFFGKKAVLKQLELMARYKLNKFHWHLTEDQGWRIQIDKYPELTTWGATRDASPKRGTYNVPDGKKYGPFFYTKADIREILKRAAELHIDVMPEIEIPGHTRSIIAAYPELGCPAFPLEKRTCWTEWGICEDVICAGNDKVLQFYYDVLDEVCELFPYAVINMGGDECPDRNWAKCPKCQARMKELGFTKPDQLQGWLTDKMGAYLAKKGRRFGGWCDIVWKGVTPPKGALVFSGCGGTGAFTAQDGYETVMAPTEYCYWDFNQGLEKDPCTYGFWWSGANPLGQVYSFKPTYGIPSKHHKNIIGGEGCNWSEYTYDVKELEWKIWPRACALSEALWTGGGNYRGFLGRVEEHIHALRLEGVNCAPAPVPEVEGVKWVDARNLPMEGRAFVNEKRHNHYDRLPIAAQGKVREPVWCVSQNSAGMQVRFRTDSKHLKFRFGVLCGLLSSPNLQTSLKSSLDVYHRLADGTWEYVKTVAPTRECTIPWTPGEACLVNLPPYNRPEKLEIGFDAGSTWEALEPRAAGHRKPVVMYGTSIAHGASPSRPGMGFVSIIGRWIDREVINLAFSGNGTMDDSMVEWLAKIDAECYIIDTVPNMPAKWVTERAERFLRALRGKKPGVPILLCEASSGWTPGLEQDAYFWCHRGNMALREIWLDLLKRDPKFCEGIRYKTEDMGMPADGEGLADGIHPNDYGMMIYAQCYADEVEKTIARVPSAVPPPFPALVTDDPCSESPRQTAPEEDVVWTKVTPDKVEGLVLPGAARQEPFQRIPESLSNCCPKAVWSLQHDTCGLQAHFRAPKGKIWFRWKLRGGTLSMWHEQNAGVAGIDVYRRNESGDWRYVWTGIPRNATNAYLSCKWLGGEGKVNFPLYNGIVELEIATKAGGVELLPPRTEKPIVVYGTSITQGCGATRPGMSHVNIMGRLLDTPVVNLGFSGSGKMEAEMVDTVAATDAQCYVLDTVWNMGGALINKNCESFVRALRKKRPGVPIVMCEGCIAFRSPQLRKGMEGANAAWRKVYDTLKAEDPKEWANLVYVSDLDYGPDGETAVDGCHANDWGLMKMGRAFAEGVRKALGKK